MLAVFEVDEYAQYPSMDAMLSGGGTFKLAIRNFLVYGHYFYGYPFFFISGLVLFPLRLILGMDWSMHTQLIMLVLRQMVNVLPNLLSALLLTFFTTRLRTFWKSTLIFCLLLLTPALVNNGFWWHPDGLGLLFVSLVLVCLQLDELRYGRFFFIAAVSAGIATGIKYMGLFFFLAIPAYLLIGIRRKTISWRTAALKAALFLAVMLMIIIITNPLLLLPLERAELLSTQIRQFSRTSAGELIGQQPFLEDGRLPSWLTEQYGWLPFLLLIAASLLVGLFKTEYRPRALLIVLFILPLAVVILSGSLQRAHYWLPVFLPLTASLAFILPDELPHKLKKPLDGLVLLVLGMIILQAVIFMRYNVIRFDAMLKREQQSASLAFYQKIKNQVGNILPADQSLSMYRDWKVYYPSDDEVKVFMDWDLASYELIAEKQPDLLLLEQVNVQTYGREDFLSNSADPQRLAPMQQFYTDALKREVNGYRLIYADGFGMVFEKEAR